MPPPALSPRLEAILESLRPCVLVADVGTDHGRIPVAAVTRGIAERAIAADLRALPLSGARRHIDNQRVGDRVELVLGDGLLALGARPVDAVVMAGMSGELMVRLLGEAKAVLARVRQLVLQPNQNADLVRGWALEDGWHVREERLLKSSGRFFITLAFVPGSGPDPAYEVPGWPEAVLLLVGPLLVARKEEAARSYCEAQRARRAALLRQGVSSLEDELALWTGACERLR